jgi:CubicO group peptidase (beta-lactamase class C family)
MHRLLSCFGLLLAAASAIAADAYPPARLPDPARITRLKPAFPEMDRIFSGYAIEAHVPGMIWGIVVDGQLVHVGTSGVRDLTSKAPITSSTVFRIASMTKSFTALAVLKLRDEGKLSLDDPVAKWIPQFGRMALPTRDTAPPTIRQLLSHSAGFPEDNPWGDQQLSASDADLTAWLERGIPFSTAPGTRYEYSNYAFGILGRIIARASGVPYERYVQDNILAQLQMHDSTFDYSSVPAQKRAAGYRLLPDGTFREEAPLPQGVFSSMGGLLTSADDLGKYVAFHLSAWPPRDEADKGPVRRSSVREMSRLWTPSNLTVTRRGGKLQGIETGYGYGLRVSTDCRFEHIVGHGGGLPGFGSYMAWLPDYGVGVFAMGTLTYSGPSEPVGRVWDAMLQTGGLQRRETAASPVLERMREPIFHLWTHWDDGDAARIAAVNLLRDVPGAQRAVEIQAIKDQVGDCPAAGPLIAENWLRGQFNLSCARGTVGVFFTLAPIEPPAVQHLHFQSLAAASERLGAPTGPPAGVACSDQD